MLRFAPLSDSPDVDLGPVAIVSHTLPGDLNGQAVMLDRLTSDTSQGGFVFIDTDRKARPRPPRPNWLACEPLPTPFLARKVFRVRRLQTRLYHALVRQRSLAIARHVRQHQCRCIVACTGGDLIDLPAAVEAGRRTRLPTFLYYFDDYQVQWNIMGGRWSRKVTGHLRDLAERHVLSHCDGVLVPNETLADDVAQRTQTAVTVIRNPVNTEAYRRLRCHHPRQPLDPQQTIKVVYTGSVYAAQADCLSRLCDAIDLLRPQGFTLELHVYGPPPCPDVCHGLPMDQICFHPPVSNTESAQLQVQADLLFLPLSFTCPYPELIRTSAPGKFGEYLASGTPLLVHAPEDSFPTTFVRQHDCGAACSVARSDSLAAAIAGMLTDPRSCEARRQRALEIAEGFSEKANRSRFSRVLSRPMARAA
jgi:glycosyltransferase involved in cell wall biosynthesis